MKIKDVMTLDPLVVPPDAPVGDVVRLLARHRVSGVFVTDHAGNPVGIVTEADLVRRLAPPGDDADMGWLARWFIDTDHAASLYLRAHGTRARDVMSRNIAFVTETDSAQEAARLMRELRIRRVAVLRQGRLVGVVSRADLLKAVLAEPDALHLDSTDQRIRDAILAEMLRQPWGDVENTTVIVEDGVVKLGGYCRSEKVRDALRVMAERVEGVQRVVDELSIGVPPVSAYDPLFPGI